MIEIDMINEQGQDFQCSECNKTSKLKIQQEKVERDIVRTYVQCDKCGSKFLVCCTNQKIRDTITKVQQMRTKAQQQYWSEGFQTSSKAGRLEKKNQMEALELTHRYGAVGSLIEEVKN